MDVSPLIQVDELRTLLSGPPSQRPVVLDVRYRMGSSNGRRRFETGHIPGASYIDLDTELATIRPDGVGGRHPMPTVETFTAAMQSAGVTMSRPVVAYDDWASLPASRVWWMLRHLGFLSVRVLDGGIGVWVKAGGPTESGPAATVKGDFTPAETGAGRLLDASEATLYAGRAPANSRFANTHVLLDARPADRFRGENETIDPVAGHIPGAVSAPALANVDANGRFLPADKLAARFERLGVLAATAPNEARTVGTYCGSGVQATHLALALAVAEVTNQADVYVGSWSDWITDPDRPVALG